MLARISADGQLDRCAALGMASSHRRRIAKLQAKQPKPKEDLRFEPWGGENPREAWVRVSAAEKAEFARQYSLAGGSPTGTIMVWNHPELGWILSTFNLPFGGTMHVLRPVLEAMTPDALVAWAEASCTPEEIEALARLIQGGWGPRCLQEGDADLLHGLVSRLPKSHPGSGGGRDVGTHQHNGGSQAKPESW